MRDLTEYEKTLTEIYLTNGRSGLHQYFRHENKNMTDDEAETKIDTLYINQTQENGKVFLTVSSIDDTYKSRLMGLEPFFEQPIGTKTSQAKVIKGEPMTVTFIDGSTKEILVAPDGQVISSHIPTPDAVIPNEKDENETVFDKVANAVFGKN